jgi:hypothetical protein
MRRFHRTTLRGSRREADLFYADLVGEPPRARPRRFVRRRFTPVRFPPLTTLPRRDAAPPAPLADPTVDDEAVSETVEEAVGESIEWLTDPSQELDVDPSTTEAPEADSIPVEDVYAPPDVRAHTPSGNASLFRTPPDPVEVTPATQWPLPATDADGATERALRRLGVAADQLEAFAAEGMAALRPIASVFGESALAELFQRLRYTPDQLAQPPHSCEKDADLTRAFGRTVPRAAILAIRTLLAIPGHFRELARRAGAEDEAYALENLGWLLMQSLAADVRTGSGIDFWLPGSPAFVGAFPAAVTGVSPQVTQLVAERSLADSRVDADAYRARFTAWQSGAPGRMWRLETGRETSSGRPAGAPFYTDPFTIPPRINIRNERVQVEAAWTGRVADFDAGRTTVPLTECDNAYLMSFGLMSRLSLRGVQLRSQFPARSASRALTVLTGLAAIQPAFEAAFQAVSDLGWNDLLFETQGLGCFRGKKVPGHPEAARSMSEHSLGIAVDLNVFENTQNTPGSMDPRIVALFEAFGFQWGKGFPVPDPMHFEYAG